MMQKWRLCVRNTINGLQLLKERYAPFPNHLFYVYAYIYVDSNLVIDKDC